MAVIEIHDTAAFDALLSGEMPVIAEFSATWCESCKMFTPLFLSFAGENDGRAVFCTIDADECPELCERYKVAVLPSLRLFKNGELVDKAAGPRPKSILEKLLQKLTEA